MGVTIRQIAAIAGVSRGTVDRAINNRGDVNPDVAKKILEIADEMGYVPNVAGKALSLQNKSKKIVVIVNSGENAFFDLLLRGVNNAAAEISSLGFKVIIKEFFGFDVNEQLKLLDEAKDEEADCIAIMPINVEEVADKLNEFIRQGIQILTLNNDIDFVNRIAYVGCDYAKSGQTAAGVFGMITGENANVGIVTGSKSIKGHNDRISGFTKVIKKEFPKIKVITTVENQDNDKISYDVVKNLLTENKQIDSLYFTAAGTKGGIEAVCDLGLDGTIKIVTFDMTLAVRQYLSQDIVSATICQQPYEQGYNAVKVLYELAMYNKKPRKTMLHTKIEIYTKYNM